MTDTAIGRELFGGLKDGLDHDVDDDVVAAAINRVFEHLGPEKTLRLIMFGIVDHEDLAVAFGKDEATIKNWVAKRQLPFVPLGNKNVSLISSIRAWLREKEVQPSRTTRGRH